MRNLQSVPKPEFLDNFEDDKIVDEEEKEEQKEKRPNLRLVKPGKDKREDEFGTGETIDKEEKKRPDLKLVKPEKDNEQKLEQQEYNINTIGDYMSLIEESIELTDDEELKRELGHQIIKLEMSLSTAQFSADKIYVEETGDGVLGLYYPSSKKIALSKDLIEDFNASQRLIAHVLYHEKAHKKGYADEYFAIEEAKRHVPINMQSYSELVARAKRFILHIGREKSRKEYDIKNPKKLINYYLEEELAREFKSKERRLEKLRDPDGLEFNTKKEVMLYTSRIKKGVPRLYKELGQSNYSIKGNIRRILRDLSKDK